ncbi:hypothetical protein BTA73_05845 [Salmonella enterica subsp. enterica serovar Reading]|uniref:hypothetical protein n=1 Tax=Salmonella enterica TaxID=28901 RepID=UPI0005C68724|nr:hypothetical protein [Salmonella enterica]EAA4605656.1 hypothetical protein [Salmonella enterica subsp. enterica serovar Kisangani]EBW2291083.1 hypothetical protein [Salmonella enterica subsp. enterica serovar Newport]EBW8769682.1 hypothetical protein [Salmonella enterica subsp. enterica serovar Reading]ECE0368268.1 hypothetical protein [Salmonella enterica subsp. enterica serovar Hvittingfoss]ECN7767707.1 hypothetical protein [Salmonella enterica subsp. enterica serovar Enteritidis]
MDDNSDNVIQLLQPKSEEEGLLNVVITDRKSGEQKCCQHIRTTISEVNRTIICDRCGLALDPFELVLDRARNGENIVSEIKSLYARRDALRESVAKLEREEKNAKARLRAARTAILFAENDLKNTEQGIKQ